MHNIYVQISLGLIVIGLGALLCAFLVAVGMTSISTAKTIARRERIKRIQMTQDVIDDMEARRDDLK